MTMYEKAMGICWTKTGKDTWTARVDDKVLFVTRWVRQTSTRINTSWVVIGTKPRHRSSTTYARATVLADGVYHDLESTREVEEAKNAAAIYALSGHGNVTGTRVKEEDQ